MNQGLMPAGWGASAGLIAGFGDRSFSIDPSLVVRVRQVHGAAIARADTLQRGIVHDIAADALVATQPGVVAAVATADCVPILLLDPATRWTAAVHSGWRGTLAGIVSRAVAAATDFGVAPTRLLAAIGPSIGGCCYEVGEDIAEQFAAVGMPVRRALDRSKPALDLRECNEHLLRSVGLPPSRIQVCGPCTRCRSDLYHSYRAHRDAAGRQLSWIGWADRSP